MLMPKKVKHRKYQKGRMRGLSYKGNTIAHGSFALKSLEAYLISSRQIEAARRAMTRYIQRGGKIWIRIFPDKPITKKSAEVPMGVGKGSLDHFAAVVQPGRILFEMDGVKEEVAREAMKRAADKLPVKTRFISKEELGY
ncbi:MAG: 50S ribosomal protein L16 [Candidatus Paceibacterota bacterium]|jgi:large subunit ribosomal protein L16